MFIYQPIGLIVGMGWCLTQIVILRILTTDNDNHMMMMLTFTEMQASVTLDDDDNDTRCHKNNNNTVITISPSPLMTPPLGPVVKYFGPMVFIYSVVQFWSNVPVS